MDNTCYKAHTVILSVTGSVSSTFSLDISSLILQVKVIIEQPLLVHAGYAFIICENVMSLSEQIQMSFLANLRTHSQARIYNFVRETGLKDRRHGGIFLIFILGLPTPCGYPILSFSETSMLWRLREGGGCEPFA